MCNCDFRPTPRQGNITVCSCNRVVNLMYVNRSTGKIDMRCSDPVIAMPNDASADREYAHEKVSADVSLVKEHLRNNRTTEREAHELHEAARRSLADHSAAKGLRKIG